MARVKKQIIGSLQGSIADIVIKYRNGKPYAASKPATANTGTDPVTVFKKNQGRFAGKLAKAIYDNVYFKKAWSDYTEKKDLVYQNIFSIHYHSINNENLEGKVFLSPLDGFLLNNPRIELYEEGINIIADPIGGNAINPEIEKQLTAAGTIILKEPNKPYSGNLDFLKIQFSKVNLDLTGPVELNYHFAPVPHTTFNNYNLRKIYVSIITLDENDIPVNFSETTVNF